MTDETEFDGYVTKYALTEGIKKMSVPFPEIEA